MHRFLTKLRDAIKARALGNPYTHLYHADGSPYMLRFWVLRIGRAKHRDTSEVQPWFGIRMHVLMTSDDDRAYHDHPWWWASLVLEGSYLEHTPAKGDTLVNRVKRYSAGSFRIHRPGQFHRLEIRPDTGPVVTLFFHGPRRRKSWGFLSLKSGRWVPWQQFGSGVVARDPRANAAQRGPA